MKTNVPLSVRFLLLLVVMCAVVCPTSAQARKKRKFYVWEDRSDGMDSLNAASIAFDPQDKKRMYAASNGVFYVSKDAGLSWWPTARFRGASRVQVQSIDLGADLRRLKQKILEEKLEDLAAEVGEELAQEQAATLEREAEEEAEEKIRQLRNRLARQGNRGRFSRYVYRILVSPIRTQQVIAITDGGAFISTNKGKSFRVFYRGRGPGVGNVVCGAVGPKDSKRVWLGTQGGLWTTTNRGKTWRRDGGMLRTIPIREVRVDPNNPKILYVATQRSLFVSRNQGKTFLRVWSLASGPDRITTMTALATRPTTVVVGTGSGLYAGKLGALRRLRRLPARGLTSRRIVYITRSKRAWKNLYVINNQGVFLSRNAGRSFRQLRAGMLTSTVRYLAISPFDPEEIWSATDYGFLRWSKLIGRSVTKAQWKRFRRKLQHEPRPWTLARAALKAFSMGQKFGSLHSRYAARGWLPTVRATARLYLDKDQSNLMLKGNGISPINLVEGRAFLFEVNLIWPLGQTIYNGQAKLTAITTNLQRFRDKLIKQVNRLYHARRRLQLRMFIAPPRKLRPYLKRTIKLQELTAQLDAITGGFFKRHLRLGNRR